MALTFEGLKACQMITDVFRYTDHRAEQTLCLNSSTAMYCKRLPKLKRHLESEILQYDSVYLGRDLLRSMNNSN